MKQSVPQLVLALASVSLACTGALPANSAPQAKITAGWPKLLAMSGPPPCGGFTDDALTLTVSEYGKEMGRSWFCSSYGRAKTRVVTDKRGVSYVLLEYAEGRGTNAVTYYLGIDRAEADLMEILRVPLSWATGPTATFSYSYVTEPLPSGGIRIQLKGQSDSGAECCVPRKRNLTVDVKE